MFRLRIAETTFKLTQNLGIFFLPQFDVGTAVRLVGLLHVGEVKIKGLRLGHLPGTRQVLHQRHELMVVTSVVVELWNGRAVQIYMLHIHINVVVVLSFSRLRCFLKYLSKMSRHKEGEHRELY